MTDIVTRVAENKKRSLQTAFYRYLLSYLGVAVGAGVEESVEALLFLDFLLFFDFLVVLLEVAVSLFWAVLLPADGV